MGNEQTKDDADSSGTYSALPSRPPSDSYQQYPGAQSSSAVPMRASGGAIGSGSGSGTYAQTHKAAPPPPFRPQPARGPLGGGGGRAGATQDARIAAVEARLNKAKLRKKDSAQIRAERWKTYNNLGEDDESSSSSSSASSSSSLSGGGVRRSSASTPSSASTSPLPPSASLSPMSDHHPLSPSAPSLSPGSDNDANDPFQQQMTYLISAVQQMPPATINLLCTIIRNVLKACDPPGSSVTTPSSSSSSSASSSSSPSPSPSPSPYSGLSVPSANAPLGSLSSPSNADANTDMNKYRKVKLKNEKIETLIVRVEGALELLMAVGFEQQDMLSANEFGKVERFLYFPLEASPSVARYALQKLEEFQKTRQSYIYAPGK